MLRGEVMRFSKNSASVIPEAFSTTTPRMSEL